MQPPIHSTLFAISKDEWNTKEDTGKCIVRTAVCQKAPLRLKRFRTVKKSSPYSSLKASVSLSVENFIK